LILPFSPGPGGGYVELPSAALRMAAGTPFQPVRQDGLTKPRAMCVSDSNTDGNPRRRVRSCLNACERVTGKDIAGVANVFATPAALRTRNQGKFVSVQQGS